MNCSLASSSSRSFWRRRRVVDSCARPVLSWLYRAFSHIHRTTYRARQRKRERETGTEKHKSFHFTPLLLRKTTICFISNLTKAQIFQSNGQQQSTYRNVTNEQLKFAKYPPTPTTGFCSGSKVNAPPKWLEYFRLGKHIIGNSILCSFHIIIAFFSSFFFLPFIHMQRVGIWYVI